MQDIFFQRLLSALGLGGGALCSLWLGPPWSTSVVLLIFLGLLGESVWFFKIYGQRSLGTLLIFLLSSFYLLGAFLFCWELVKISFSPEGTRQVFQIFVYLCALVWATDISAYGVGKSIGGKRLAPRLSPQKTWAGFWGGLLGGSLAGILAFPPFLKGPSLSILGINLGISLGTIGLVLVAQGGDLLESAVKRYFGAKDTSALIPGHGGLWDRLDSLLAVTFVLFCLKALR